MDENKQAEHVAANHSGLIKRIDAAIERVTQGRGLMSIPSDPRSDVDLVLSECKALLQGENPPFWAADFHPAPAVLVKCPSDVCEFEIQNEALQKVNAQLLEALKPFAVFGRVGSRDVEVRAAIDAIAAAEAAKKGGV